MHENNCFITLTFSPEELERRENPGSVDLRDWQLFMRRLRKRFGYHKKLHPERPKIKYFHCGEYGDKYGRPHYHACLFNFAFPDQQFWKLKNGQKLYTSEILEELWPYGFCTVGSMTFESAAYVARYVLKKITGKKAIKHYERIDPDTGEITRLKPEYNSMSKKPGLASGWLKKYESDVYPHDEVIINGHPTKPPRYYDNQYELKNPQKLAAIKKTRELKGLEHKQNSTIDRLAVREEIQYRKLDELPRNHDAE